MRLVLDASAAVNAVIPGDLRDPTRRYFADAELFAPTLIDTEVLSALARLERADVVTTAEADAALLAWTRLPCTRLDTEPALADVWAMRHSLRISDAHYVVLARMLDAPLLTADARLGRAAVRDISLLVVR